MGKLGSELEEIKTKTQCDVVELLHIEDGKGITNGTAMSKALRSRIESGASRISIETVAGRLALLSYSPLKLYRDVVGVAVLGYFLNGAVTEEIYRGTGAMVAFASPAERVGQGIRIDISENDSGEAVTEVTVDTPTISLARRDIGAWIIVVGVISLVLVVLLNYAFLSLGFLKHFRSVLSEINKGAGELDSGVIEEVPERKYRIQEMSLLSGAVSKYSRSLKNYADRVAKKTRVETIGEFAAQAAHDIDGPLSVLEMDLNLDGVKEFSDVRKARIRARLDRIRNVASVFSEMSRAGRKVPDIGKAEGSIAQEKESVCVGIVVRDIVSEKRAQYGRRLSVSIESEVPRFGLFVDVNSGELKRAISNLIDNAVEAIPDEGVISVRVLKRRKSVVIRVTDTGRGISKDVLHRLGERGVSYGKEKGSGLGLWHARTMAEGLGGKLEIRSEVGSGTTVEISMPVAKCPLWFVKELVIPDDSEVVVPDDEKWVHDLWEERLAGCVMIHHFYRAAEAIEWSKKSSATPPTSNLTCSANGAGTDPFTFTGVKQ